MTESDVPQPKPILRAERVTKTFGHRRSLTHPVSTFVCAVDDVSLDVLQGEALGLVGESGSGKTSLGRLLVGLDRPTGSDILYKLSLIHI